MNRSLPSRLASSSKIERIETTYIDIVEAIKREAVKYADTLEKNNLSGNHDYRSIPIKLKNIEKATKCDSVMVGMVLRTFLKEMGVPYDIGKHNLGRTYHLLLSMDLILSWKEPYK